MSAERRLELDDLQIDLDRQTVERGGERLDVAGLSFRLLAYLVTQGDRVVSFDALIEAVWAPAVVGEETVTQRIKLLRQALGDDGRRPRYVRSVRGQGYQLCAVARPVSAVSAATIPTKFRTTFVVLGVAALLALLAVVGVFRERVQRHAAADAPVAREAVDEVLQRASYYASIGQDANNENAITLYESILANDGGDVGAMLGLSRALSARMCLYNRGSGSIDRAESLARAVLAGDARNSRAHDALAYSVDCRGLIDAALAEYERAYALDPVARFDSRASAAYLYAVKGRLSDALKANIDVAEKRDVLRFLDIQIASNLELLGFVAAAEQRYERNFRLFPDSVYSNAAWPRSLFLQGRLVEAEAAVAEAMKRPQHPELHILAGELALLRGDRPAAVAAFATAHALRPQTTWPDTLLHVYGSDPVDSRWLLAQIGQVQAGIDAGEALPELHIELVVLELARGDRAAALDALEAAVAAGFCDRALLLASPFFKALAGEPRMAASIDRISQHVARERATVLAADWLPSDLLSVLKASP